MKPLRKIALLLGMLLGVQSFATHILVPMDDQQQNHLKAYGLAYWVLQRDIPLDWLLNYRGGSFMCQYSTSIENELQVRGISFDVIPDTKAAQIKDEIASPEVNMDVMKLEKPPKVAVYSPKTKLPWDDAVTMALKYAEIPYTVIYDDEVMVGDLPKFDWLHLHHEDFTGQYGKFYAMYKDQAWYRQQQADYEASAKKHGFNKVSQLKLATVQKIREFVAGGGFLFAMCSATETFDIALSASHTDICEHMFDGDAADPSAQSKLNFVETFAFKNFKLVTNPYEYEYASIDSRPNNRPKLVEEKNDYFSLFSFSAKWDPIPCMLTQCHTQTIKGFMGQTTAFNAGLVKSEVTVLGENKTQGEVRYIHGTVGKGTWTFYGGHDPEDYEHFVTEDPTDLNLFPNSAGYRLILNNILFPAAKKKKQKT